VLNYALNAICHMPHIFATCLGRCSSIRNLSPSLKVCCRLYGLELLATLKVLAQFGPQLGRPKVDTLNGSLYPNMKELRFQADGVMALCFCLQSATTSHRAGRR
jgi:hypothetical protein